jgi:hypothetical protein
MALLSRRSVPAVKFRRPERDLQARRPLVLPSYGI